MKCNSLILWRDSGICLLESQSIWYIYSPMDTGPIGYYQGILRCQIVHCRFEAMGIYPWTHQYSRLIGTAGRF